MTKWMAAMRRFSFIGFFAWVGVTSLLAACGGGGGSSPRQPGPGPEPVPAPIQVAGQVAKAKVAGATVTARVLATDGSAGAALATATTDSDGRYQLALPASFAGPVLVVATGGHYVDEATGATVALADGDRLEAVHVVAAGGSARINVTPLTTLASAKVRWEVAAGQPLAQAIADANASLSSQFGIDDILTAAIPDLASMGSATASERHYALFLAGFSQLGANDASRTALQVVASVAANFAQTGAFGQGAEQITAGQLINATLSFIANHPSLAGVAVDPAVLANLANIAPVASDDAAVTDEDVALSLPAATLLANDTDADADVLRISAAAGNAATRGQVTLANQTVIYTPPADFSGEDVFVYTVADGRGGSAMVTVRITVLPVNDAPRPGADVVTTEEDSPITMATSMLLANDVDVDGDDFALTAVTALADSHGLVTLANDEIRYVPDADFNGTAHFEYTVVDVNGASARGIVTVTVTPVPDVPVAVDDGPFTVNEDPAQPLTMTAGQLLGNDSDADGEPLSLVSVTATAETHGTVELVAGVVRYRPAANYYGPAAFTYVVSDPTGRTATATVRIEVIAQPDAPTIGGVPAAEVHIGETYAFTPIAADADGAGEVLTFSVRNLPSWASFDPLTGTLSGVPGAGAGGTRAQGVVITVADGAGLSASLPAFDIWVVPVVLAPVIDPYAGTYMTSVEVRLATATADAEIRYTTDGSDPSTGTRYTGPFTLTSSATVKAQAFKPGYDASAVVSRRFDVSAGSGLPLLTGTLAAPSALVNVTQEGATDWAHWGLGGAANFNHRAGVAQQISGLVVVGTSAASVYTNAAAPQFAWSDGAPTATQAGYAGGLSVPGLNNGYEFTVPADTTERTLNVYVGVRKALGRLEATLSDGSAAPVVLDVSNAAGLTFQTANLRFRAGGPNQFLTVRYTYADTLGTTGNVILFGATLVNAAALPVAAAPLISVPGGYFGNTAQVQITSATPGATIRYTLDGSDPAYGDVYTGPITLTASARLTAQAFADGYLPSLANSESFVQGACAATRIMPTGDSITYGTGSTPTEGDAVGYRRKLYLDLTAGGANVDLVGSQDNGSLSTTGPAFDTQHEGHGGWRIADVANNIYNWLTANPADIVLLHIGTNDTAGAGTYTDPMQLSQLLDEIDRFSKSTRVVLARIINENPKRGEVKLFNQNVAAMAGARIINGDRLTVVDMEPVLDYSTDMYDKLHPNIVGYEKMAIAWLGAVQPLLPACLP